MPAETLRLDYSRPRRENCIKQHPLKRIIIFLAVLIGMAVAIAMQQGKEPARLIAAA